MLQLVCGYEKTKLIIVHIPSILMIYDILIQAAGWVLSAFGIMQLPIWACVAFIKQPGKTWQDRLRGSFRPTADWGPIDPVNFEGYRKLRATIEAEADRVPSRNWFVRFKRNIFG